MTKYMLKENNSKIFSQEKKNQVSSATEEENNGYGNDYSRKLLEERSQQEKKDKIAANKVLESIKKSAEPEEERLFPPREIFNPEKEIGKIRKGAKAWQWEKLAKFKERLAFQKEGIAQIQRLLYEKFEKNEFRDVEEIRQNIFNLENKYALSNKQRGLVEKAADICWRQHNSIQQNIGDCLKRNGNVDGKKLFEKIFRRPPQGKVEVIIKPITVYFRLFNDKDFAYALSGEYFAGRNIDDNDLKNASRYGGAKLGNSHFPGLENAVAIERTPNFFRRNFTNFSQRVLVHEDQHSFNDLIDQALGSAYKNKDKKNFITKEKKWDNIITRRAKNEICAYFKDGSTAEEIRRKLMKGSIYAYGQDYQREAKKYGEKFSEEYIKIIEEGIVSIFDLVKYGYPKEDALALLTTEDISKWKKVVERQLGWKKSQKEEKKDRRRLTSFSEKINEGVDKKIRMIKYYFKSKIYK